MAKAPKGCEKVGKHYRCRIQSPKQFDKRSFRTISTGDKKGTKLIIGCPKGKYDAKKKRCKVGTRAQSKLIPI